MPYPNEYSCRLHDPDGYKDPWARVKRKSKSKRKTYSVIRGTSKASGKMEDQAYRYPKKTWSASEAKSHCKAHKGSYEAIADILKLDALIEESLKMKKEKYDCECTKCGHKVTSEKHCDKLKCPKCGGQMRRAERPGPGKEGSANEGALLARFATRVVNTPLMIASDKLNAIINVIGSRIGLDTDDTETDYEASSREEKKDEPHIAVIPIHDTLVHRAAGLSAMSGLTTYEQIGKSFKAALEDPKVTQIVLDIDSPGGEVSGVFDLVDEIYNARGIKPITAAVNDIAYSAAYAIASAADKVYVPRTGGTGSIGVIAVHTDLSEANKKAGVKYTSIYAGKKKNEFSPHEKISAEAFADVQSKVDSVYDLFVETVARNRNINPKDVKATEAGIFLGEEGLEVGLADQILSWNQIIETITTEEGGISMSFKEDLDLLLIDAPKEEVAEAFKVLGYIPEKDLPDVEAIKAEAKEEAVKEYKEQHTGDEQETQDVVELRQEIEVLKGEVAESKKETETEKDARRQLELTKEITDIGVVGDVKKQVRVIFTVEKMNPDLAQEMLDQLKETGEALNASGFFTEIGSSGHGPTQESSTAFDQLKAKVDALIKEGIKPSEAWKRAVKENPELYKTYVNGRK